GAGDVVAASAYTSYDRLASDVALVCYNAILAGSNALKSVVSIVRATDNFIGIVSSSKLDDEFATSPDVLALSPTRCLVRAKAARGPVALDIVDNTIERLTVTDQLQGVLSRAWVTAAPQDDVRALVFE